jgi:hypothetical protein
MPSAGQAVPAGTASASAGAAPTPNMSGEYTGKVTEGSSKGDTVTSSLAQHADALGGPLSIASGTATVTGAVAFSISGRTELRGSGASTEGTATCVIAFAGAYDPVKHKITASFHHVNGCSVGGSFTMKQQCYYARKGAQAEVGGLKMC